MLERDKTPSVDDDRSKLSSQAQQPPQSACVHCRSLGYSTLFQLHYCAASAAVMALCQPASTVKPGCFFLSQRLLTRFCPHSSGTDDFKPPRKGVLLVFFSPHFQHQNNPWLPVPAGVLCIQWCLATENAGRSNQSCFTSLDPLPELGCRLAAAKKKKTLVALHRLAGNVNAACCEGKCLSWGVVFFHAPYRSSAYRWSDKKKKNSA